jgi:hypothetical protein
VRRAGTTATSRSPLGRSGFTRTPTVDRAAAARRGFVQRPTLNRSTATSPRPSTTVRRGTATDRARAATARTGRAGVRTARTATARAGTSGYHSTARHRHGYNSASHSRYGYYGRARVGHAPRSHYRAHSWYHDHGWYLSFYFGFGSYLGVRYYYPYYDYVCRSHFAFFYPDYVSYAYVPFGFYCDAPAVYIDRSVYIREEYPVERYEVVEVEDEDPAAAPTPEQETVEPEPAAESPMAEKLLREASESFRATEYEEAARKFRLAAIAAPDSAGPLFALGQALLALGEDDAYAARVVRKAVRMNADLVREPGDISGVYKDQDEFARVMAELAKRAETSADAFFLLGLNRYLTGDPDARRIFDSIVERDPDDDVAALFKDNVAERFKAADELPPIK